MSEMKYLVLASCSSFIILMSKTNPPQFYASCAHPYYGYGQNILLFRVYKTPFPVLHLLRDYFPKNPILVPVTIPEALGEHRAHKLLACWPIGSLSIL